MSPADFDRALDAVFPLTRAEKARERALLAAIKADKKRVADACAGRTLLIGSADCVRRQR